MKKAKIVAAQLIEDLKSGEYESYRKELQEHLKIIDLSSPQLEELLVLLQQEGLSETISRLTVQGGELKMLSEKIGTLTKLRVLSVKSEKLQIIPDNLGQCTKMRRFYSDSKELKALPESLGYCSELTSIRCGNSNPIVPDSLGSCPLEFLDFDFVLGEPPPIDDPTPGTMKRRWYALQVEYCKKTIEVDEAFTFTRISMPSGVIGIIASYGCVGKEPLPITHQLLAIKIGNPLTWITSHPNPPPLDSPTTPPKGCIQQ